MPREYYREYGKTYYSLPEVRARRNEQMKAYAKRPDLAHKHHARRAVRRAIERGELTRHQCEVCGSTKVDAHHDDYTQPLNVRWLCRQHHVELHAKAEGR